MDHLYIKKDPAGVAHYKVAHDEAFQDTGRQANQIVLYILKLALHFCRYKITFLLFDLPFPVDMWVLYASAKYLVIMECYHTQDNGTCLQEDAFIEVLSRSRGLDSDERGDVYDVMTKSCFDMTDYIASYYQSTGSKTFPFHNRDNS